MTTGTGHALTAGADRYGGRLFSGLPPPELGSLDAFMDASHDGPFAVDPRRLSPADSDFTRAAFRERAGVGTSYSEVSPLDAYDIVVHLPRVTAAERDENALAHSPDDVREALSRWRRPR